MNGLPTDRELPLMEHITELRSRLFVVFAVLIFAVLLAYPFSGTLIDIIWADLMPPDIGMVVYSPLEWIITRLMLCLVIAAASAIPLFMYEAFAFMKTGLYPSEKRFFLLVVPPSFVMFIIGAGTAYYIVIPLIFNYMVFYSADVASSGLSVKQTFSIVTTMVAIFGLLFQFPILVTFSIKSGLLKRHQLKNKRMLVYGILIAFAMFVAPDVTGMSQLIMAFFLVLLFEFSLLVSRYI
jgi:sec-independent protein translocase protein TatC